MRLPRISNFLLHKPFEPQDPTTGLSEIALRLVIDLNSDTPEVIGTATVVCDNLLLTAKHVIEKIFDSEMSPDRRNVISDRTLAAVQILPGPRYVIWDAIECFADPISDIALLRLANNPARSDNEERHQWKLPRINPFPPEVGETIAAFGYRRGRVLASSNALGGHHIDFNDEPMVSVGVVRQIYEWQRDHIMLPFPCYQVSARFGGDMSGGPVFDETGCLCGIICNNVDGSQLDGEIVSNVTTLWPLFMLNVDADRGENHPRGVRVPVIEFARDLQIVVSDLPRLDRWFAEHIVHTQSYEGPKL